MAVVERIYHYLKGSIDFFLLYSPSNAFYLIGYCDSDF
jgi:hypothetical protein